MSPTAQAARSLRDPDRKAADAAEHAAQAVLGLCMRDIALWRKLPKDFSDILADPLNRIVHRAMGILADAGKPVDVLLLHEQLDRMGLAERVGLKYLHDLQIGAPERSANIEHYVEIVRARHAAEQEKLQQAEIEDLVRDRRYDDAKVVLEQIARPQVVRKCPPLDLRALASRVAPPRVWRRPEWLGTGPTVLAGAGGDGKSTFVQHEATAGALGLGYLGREGDAYSSVVWNCEDEGDEMWRREERICRHEQIDMASLAERLFLVSRYGHDNALMAQVHGRLVETPLMRELREQVNDLAIDVLWLDNAAHVFLGNHDDRTEVTAFMNALNGLVSGRPFSVVIVTHPGRAMGSEYSGSVAWENAARMRWYLSKKLPGQQANRSDDEDGPRDEATRYLSKRKSNYSAQDSLRFTMQAGLLVPESTASSHVDEVVRAGDRRRAEEVCVAGFKALKAIGINSTDGKNSGDFLPKHLAEKGMAEGYSTKDLAAAMHRLMGAGVFVRGVVGKYSNRSEKLGLVLIEP